MPYTLSKKRQALDDSGGVIDMGADVGGFVSPMGNRFANPPMSAVKAAAPAPTMPAPADTTTTDPTTPPPVSSPQAQNAPTPYAGGGFKL